jgi:hypothetical protein
VRVRKRKGRQGSRGLLAIGAAPATDLNPIVMLIMRLLGAAPVADDRIAFTNGAAPQDHLDALFGPIGFELVRRGGKWDKRTVRSSWPVDSDLPVKVRGPK